MRGLTYKQISKALGISEASVKRTFADESFTLSRLEEVCQLAGITLYELARLAEGIHEQANRFTLEQETLLASDPKLFDLFYLLFHGKTVSDIEKEYVISRREIDSFLLKLDKLNLVELSESRVRVKIKPHTQWLAHGPLIRLYAKKMQEQFFDSDFASQTELLRFVPGVLAPESAKLLKHKVLKLLQDFEELKDLDSTLRSQAKPIHILVAFRPWIFRVTDGLRKKQS